MPRGDTVCVDLRRIPVGTGLYFFAAYTIATLVIAYLGFLLAGSVLLTTNRDAQLLGVASAVAAWAVTWIVAWRRESRGIPQDDPGRQPGERERAAVGRVAAVAAALGIEPPRVVVTRTFQNRGAWVSGLTKPYTLVVERVFAKNALSRPDLFDAAIAHELAHVASGDARRLALFRALAVVLSVLLLCALGVPCARFILQTARDAPEAMLAPFVPTEWLSWRALEFAAEFPAPAVATVLAFRLGYARLLRRQELFADWRAAASGYGRALRDAAIDSAAVRPASRWLSCLQIFPTAAHRAWMLSDPARHNRTSAADYVLLGAVLIVAATWLTDSGLYSFTGVSLLSARARGARRAPQSEGRGLRLLAGACKTSSAASRVSGKSRHSSSDQPFVCSPNALLPRALWRSSRHIGPRRSRRGRRWRRLAGPTAQRRGTELRSRVNWS